MQQALRSQASRAPHEGSALVCWTQIGGLGRPIGFQSCCLWVWVRERPQEDATRKEVGEIVALDNFYPRSTLMRMLSDSNPHHLLRLATHPDLLVEGPLMVCPLVVIVGAIPGVELRHGAAGLGVAEKPLVHLAPGHGVRP